MIRQSFIFLERVGDRLEQRIWQQGIRSWNEFLSRKRILGISPLRKAYYDRRIRQAKQHLMADHAGYFTSILPAREHWRLYSYFREQACFLDIEATGVGRKNSIILLGWSDGDRYRAMIRGINWDTQQLGALLQQYKLLLTFNGSAFDLPCITRRFPDLLPDIPHLDLRHAACQAGLTGSLKEIEQQLGIKRSTIIGKIAGGDPSLLWRRFQATGDEDYLRLLLEYNEEDVCNLKRIADAVVARLAAGIANPAASMHSSTSC